MRWCDGKDSVCCGRRERGSQVNFRGVKLMLRNRREVKDFAR